jgi:hypothetical protein
MIDYLLFSLGLVPALATRVFTPIFFSMAFARLGPQYEWLAHLEGVEVLSHVPSWMLTDSSLGICFILMCLELAAEKSPDLREVMGLVDSKVKAAAAFALCMAMAGSDSTVSGARHLLSDSWVPLAQVGAIGNPNLLEYFWAAAIGFAVWLTAVLRRGLYNFLADIDPGDDFGIARLFSWAEDFFGFFIFLAAVFLPILAITVAGGVVLSLYLIRKILESREERQKVPCSNCGAPNSLCGVACGKCGQTRTEIRRVGPLGGIREERMLDFHLHQFELLGRKRCPNCGERLRDRRLGLPCGECRRPPFRTPAEVEAYLSWLQAKLPKVLFILAICSFLPLLGLIPGILYYRISLISSLRHYLPVSVSFLGRWVTRFINLFLLCLQPIPILGIAALPLMCLTNYYLYRSLLRGQAVGQLLPPPLPLASHM